MAFLSEKPQRSETYAALSESDKIVFARVILAIRSNVEFDLMDAEKVGASTATFALYASTFLGTIVYLYGILQANALTSPWWWAFALVSFFTALGIHGHLRDRVLDIELQRFSNYTATEKSACVGVMRVFRQIIEMKLPQFLLMEFLGAPFIAVFGVLSIVIDGPSKFFDLG